jgi:hypothetical protein
MNKPNNTNDIDLDLAITKIDRRTMGGGTWVIGTVSAISAWTPRLVFHPSRVSTIFTPERLIFGNELFVFM